MSEQNNTQIISVIDIGTTKIIALIADYNLEENKINKIIGFGESESNGLKSGVVVNIRDTIKSITKAVESAEEQAEIEMTEVFVGISGNHIKGINYSGVAPINSANSLAIGIFSSLPIPLPIDTIKSAEESSVKFRRSIYAIKDIKKGERFTMSNIRSIRPGLGLPPKYLDKILSSKSKCDINYGTPISFDLIERKA